MRKTTLTFLIFILCGIGFRAQSQEAVFAYARKGWNKYQPKEIGGYKYQVTKVVYDKLIRAKGDYRAVVPDLVMNNGTDLIAWMDPEKLQIGIEEQAYDVCTTFGKDSLNALAALLAHEITHYYEKHDWARQFAQQSEKESGPELLTLLEDKQRQETQADHLGGLLAFSAGFNTYHITGPFLKEAYAAYRFPDQLEGYPVLRERIKMAENTAQQLLQQLDVWETANLLSVIEAHDLAKTYYQHILKFYQGYEVFNNAGVNAVLAALQLFEPEEWPYALPLELDATSRLSQLKQRLPDDPETQREKLLEEATRLFESAVNMAKDYAPALLNMACVFALQDQWDDAEYFAHKARKRSQQNQNEREIANTEILLGVIAARQNDVKEAQKWLEQARKGNPALANLNLTVLQKSKLLPPQPADRTKGVEQIEGLMLDDFLAQPEVDRTITMSETVFCGVKQGTGSKLLLHYADEGKSYVLFHQTEPAYTGQSLGGIRLGDLREKIIELYGQPSADLQLRYGSYLHYKTQPIFFELNEQGAVVKWVTYQKELD